MIKNKNILITGGNSGIGFFAIINLLKTKNNYYVLIKSELRKNQFLKTFEKYFDRLIGNEIDGDKKKFLQKAKQTGLQYLGETNDIQ